MAGVVRGVAEFLLAGDHGVDRGLLHLLNPLPPRLSLGPPSLSLPALPPAEVAAATALRLVAVNLGNVALTVLTVVTVVTVVRVLELVVLQVVRALTGLQVSDVSPSHPAKSQPRNFSLECDGQQVFLSSLFLQLFLFLSVLEIRLTLELLVLLLTGIFPLLQ